MLPLAIHLLMYLCCHWQYTQFMAKMAPKRKHDKPLQIRMTEDLRDLIHAAASKGGLTTSGWVRDRLARLARREIRESGDEAPRRRGREE